MNCLDRHVAKDPSAVAIIWEKNEPGDQEEITYKYVCCSSGVESFRYVDYSTILHMFFCHLLHCRDLLEQTCQIANVLRNAGVQKGDKVMIYMPMMPLAVAAMLACARMGAVHW